MGYPVYCINMWPLSGTWIFVQRMASCLVIIFADSYMVQLYKRRKKEKCQPICLSGVRNICISMCRLFFQFVASRVDPLFDDSRLLFLCFPVVRGGRKSSREEFLPTCAPGVRQLADTFHLDARVHKKIGDSYPRGNGADDAFRIKIARAAYNIRYRRQWKSASAFSKDAGR